MTKSAVTTQREFDVMDQEARAEAKRLFGEWLKEFYGERPVPGSEAEMSDAR